MERAFWDIVAELNPDHVAKLIKEIVDALCCLVPSRTDIHEKIRNETLLTPTPDNEPLIRESITKWVETFQSPVHDRVTRGWSSLGTVDFLRAVYAHLEVVHREVWEARKRIADGESPIPPEHRPKPFDGTMRTGR